MALTTATTTGVGWTVDPDLWRCVGCGHGPLAVGATAEGLRCASCGRDFPIRDGILVVNDEPTDNNKVVRAFYDGPSWPKFRFWEWLTFVINGGEPRARNKILRHLPTGPALKLLDVAIGDGVYLPWLPTDWRITGIDISPVQLQACRRRAAATGRDLPLALGMAEALPFHDRRFDAVLSIGGFNYFNDPEGALREMVRVTRPGGTIVVADEVPDLNRQMKLGRLLGLPGLDRWAVRRVTHHLGIEFNAIVDRLQGLDIAALGRRVLPECRYELVWQGVGYVLVGQVPG